MSAEAKTAAQEWRDGWTLVLATFVGFSMLSVMSSSLSMFIEPISREFGWKRAFVPIGFTVTAVITAVLSPAFGVAIDRWGSRRVGLPGIVAAAVAISAMSLATPSQAVWIALWVSYALLAMAVKPTVWTAAVVRRFSAAQGLALGLTLCGTAAANTIIPPLTNWLINEFGWRMAYVWLGTGWGAVTFVLCLLFLHDAQDRRPVKHSAERTAAQALLPGLNASEAFRSRAIWRVAATSFIIMLLTIGLSIHQIEILGEAGVSRTNAAWLASLAGIAGIAGKLITGALLDRFRANLVAGLSISATSLAFALLINGIHSPVLIVIAMIVNGYSAGTKLQIASYLTARFAGPRSYGTIYGSMNSVIAMGSGLGPVAAGFAYDATGTYQPFLIAGTIGCLVCGFLLFTLPPYPIWTKDEPEPDARIDPATVLRG